MKVKIAGIISFLAAAGWGTFWLIEIFKHYSLDDEEIWLFIFLIIIPALFTIIYVLWTKFGHYASELGKLEHENQLLIKKIEQRELKKKLEEAG